MNKENKKERLVLLAWLDVLERIDTLVLEIRHIQTNIIYDLRVPSLYRILRYEESRIWTKQSSNEGGDQRKEDDGVTFTKVLTHSYDRAIEQANRMLHGFPRFGEILDKDKWGDIFDDHDEHAEYWLKTHWNTDQKRHYHNLCSLQLVKANLIKDKVAISWWAIRLFKLANATDYKRKLDYANFDAAKTEHRLAHFMVLRAAVLAKTRQHVEWVGDLQSQYEMSQDIGRQDHPRPSLARRREQGIYTTFLADRCRDISIDIDNLLGSIKNQSISNLQKRLTMHRWKHEYSSKGSVCLSDTCFQKEKSGIPEVGDLRKINFINTSYWMPERPDLQSVIAHESAHVAIHKQYSQFADITGNKGNDGFSQLIRELHHCLECFEITTTNAGVYPRHYPGNTLKEIAADLLATSVKGNAYIYALFLEICGMGLEVMYDSPVERYELAMAFHFGKDGATHALDREWYYRLRLVCSWMRCIRDSEISQSFLDVDLIDGIEATVESMLLYLNSLNNNKPYDYPFWKTVTDRMCDIVSKSLVASEVKEWRKNRNADEERRTRESRYYDKHNRHLPDQVRDYLIRNIIHHKWEYISEEFFKKYPKEKTEQIDDVICPLEYESNSSEQKQGGELEKIGYLLNIFDKRYLGKSKYSHFPDIANDDKIHRLITDRSLFEYLHDIPWQCSLLRAKDYLSIRKKETSRAKDELGSYIYQLHCGAPLGRELYQVAIEFELWTTKSSILRLQKAYEIIKEIFRKEDDDYGIPEEKNELKIVVENILDDGSTRKLKCYLEQTTKEIEKDVISWDDLEKRIMSEEILKTVSVKSIITIGHLVGNAESLYKNILEKIAINRALTLREALETIEKQLEKPVFTPLIHYLPTQEGGFSVPAVLDRLDGVNGNSLIRTFKTHMLSRLCISGEYGLIAPKSSEKISSRQACTIDKCDLSHELSKSILGRYDYILISPTRPMCRCELPVWRDDENEFPSFFIRRELGLPFRIAGDRKKGISAVLSITLNHRNERLDFLERIILAEQDSTSEKNGDIENKRHIENVGRLIKEICPIAFLTEGWGDILLILDTEETEKALENIFLLQNVMFQDFMVDYTELMLSHDYLEIGNKNEKYDLTIQLRPMECRSLLPANENFVDTIKGNAKNIGNNGDNLDVDVVRTPGRMDFRLKINKNTKFDLNRMRKLLENCNIDVVQTTIGKRE